MPSCKVHWCHWKTPIGLSRFFLTSGVVEIQRPHIKLACVPIGLETVSLVFTHTYPKWTNTHLSWPFSLERQLWSLKSWSYEGIITNAISSICRNSVLEVILKDRPWAIYFVQAVSCQGDGMRYLQSLWGQVFFSWVCFSLGETHLIINKEELLGASFKVKICKIRLQPTRYPMTAKISGNPSSCKEILPTWCCWDKKYMLIA